jgi:hypothetical protein
VQNTIFVPGTLNIKKYYTVTCLATFCHVLPLMNITKKKHLFYLLSAGMPHTLLLSVAIPQSLASPEVTPPDPHRFFLVSHLGCTIDCTAKN